MENIKKQSTCSFGRSNNKVLNTFPTVTGTVRQRRFAIMLLCNCPLA